MVGFEHWFGVYATKIEAQLDLVCADNPSKVFRHIELLLQVVPELTGEEPQSIWIEISIEFEAGILRSA